MGCGCDQASVETDITGRTSSDDFQFSTVEICFNNAVFLIQNGKNLQLDRIFQAFLRIWDGTDQDIQFFTFEAFCQRTLILSCGQMRQQVADIENRIGRIFTDIHCNSLAVLLVNHTVKRKRNSCPLILADAAIVVCLEISNIILLIDRCRFQIQSRCIDMSSIQTDTFI